MLQRARIFTARKRSLGQGNIFTPVCHSVHGRGLVVSNHALQVLSQHALQVSGGGIPACLAGLQAHTHGRR